MLANSTPARAPYVKTSDLETLARELFGGGMGKLPPDPLKRRAALVGEFADAHLNVPGVAKPDGAKLAALPPALRAVAAGRQARVDAFIAALQPGVTIASVQAQLVQILGAREMSRNLLRAKEQIAAALVLVSILESGSASAAQIPDDLIAAAQRLGGKLDAISPDCRAHFIPRGSTIPTVGRGIELLAQLCDAVLAERASATPPAHPASAPKSSIKSAEQLAAAIRAESDPIKRAHLFSQFKNLK